MFTIVTSLQPPLSNDCASIVPDYYSITMPFKQGLTAHWQSADNDCIPDISHPLYQWLFDVSSLTKRLSAHSQHFEVKILSQSQGVVSQQEQALFHAADIQCREVLLLCDGIAQVYARTLMPLSTLEHANQHLKTLGNSSLGGVLFNDPSMRRSAIEVCHFDQLSTLAMMSQQLLLPSASTIWGRRSMFHLQNYPLSVAEFFLPGAYAYSKSLL